MSSTTAAAATSPSTLDRAAYARVLNKFRGQSILSVAQFSRDDLDVLLSLATHMEHAVLQHGTIDVAKGLMLAAIFYEPSTRTSSSFQCAMQRLGGGVLAINDVSSSSVSKGETIEDTARCLECYVDGIVMRHPQVGSVARAAGAVKIPVINAGDGIGEHPTQALLDLYTIQAEREKITGVPHVNHIDGLTITMLGDLKHGRTVHSLAKLLSLFRVKLNYVSPSFLALPDDVQAVVGAAGVPQRQCENLADVLAETDVLYVTRVQKERFTDMTAYETACNAYRITPELLQQLNAKSTLRILHPLPRVNEISTEVDDDPRAAYFRQMRCGLYMRMALLSVVFGRAMKLDA